MAEITLWNQISSYIRGSRSGSFHAPVLYVLANSSKPLRAAEIFKEAKTRKLSLSRTKLYDALKKFGELGIVTKTAVEYPESFYTWSRAQQRRWRSKNGYKKIPPLQFTLDMPALLEVITKKCLEEIDETRAEFMKVVSLKIQESNHLMDFIKSYSE